MNDQINSAINQFCRQEAECLEIITQALTKNSEPTHLLANLNTPCQNILLELAGRWGADMPGLASLDDVAGHFPTDELHNLILMACAFMLFGHSAGIGYEENMGELRRHSLATAIVSGHLAHYFPGDQHDLFTACLFHDIGKAVLNSLIVPHILLIRQLMLENSLSFIEIEKKLLGNSHAEIGAGLGTKLWGNPRLAKAILHHHQPLQTESVLAHFVSLADTITMTLGFATNLDTLKYPSYPELYRHYHLHTVDLQVISRDSIDQINRIIPYMDGPWTQECTP